MTFVLKIEIILPPEQLCVWEMVVLQLQFSVEKQEVWEPLCLETSHSLFFLFDKNF